MEEYKKRRFCSRLHEMANATRRSRRSRLVAVTNNKSQRINETGSRTRQQRGACDSGSATRSHVRWCFRGAHDTRCTRSNDDEELVKHKSSCRDTRQRGTKTNDKIFRIDYVARPEIGLGRFASSSHVTNGITYKYKNLYTGRSMPNKFFFFFFPINSSFYKTWSRLNRKNEKFERSAR